MAKFNLVPAATFTTAAIAGTPTRSPATNSDPATTAATATTSVASFTSAEPSTNPFIPSCRNCNKWGPPCPSVCRLVKPKCYQLQFCHTPESDWSDEDWDGEYHRERIRQQQQKEREQQQRDKGQHVQKDYYPPSPQHVPSYEENTFCHLPNPQPEEEITTTTTPPFNRLDLGLDYFKSCIKENKPILVCNLVAV